MLQVSQLASNEFWEIRLSIHHTYFTLMYSNSFSSPHTFFDVFTMLIQVFKRETYALSTLHTPIGSTRQIIVEGKQFFFENTL